MGSALAIGSDREPIFTLGLLTPGALGADFLTFFLQLAVIYRPMMQGIFDTTALP